MVVGAIPNLAAMSRVDTPPAAYSARADTTEASDILDRGFAVPFLSCLPIAASAFSLRGFPFLDWLMRSLVASLRFLPVWKSVILFLESAGMAEFLSAASADALCVGDMRRPVFAALILDFVSAVCFIPRPDDDADLAML